VYKELKDIFKHSIIYGLGNISTKVVGFLMIPIYTRYLTTKEYGIIELIDLTASIVIQILTMGFTASVIRFYYKYNDTHQKAQLISTALIFNIISSAITIIILITFVERLSLLVFGTIQYARYLTIGLLTIFFEICLITPFAYIRAIKASTYFTIITIIRLIIGVSLNIYFLVFLKKGVIGILYSGLITGIISAILMVSITFYKVGIHFVVDKLRQMLSYGIPLVPDGWAMFILNFADRYFLRYFSTLNIIGIYSLGYKFGVILQILITQSFQQIWSAAMFTIVQNRDAKQIFARIATYFGFVMIFSGLFISIFIKDILKIMATPPFFNAYKIVPLIIISYLFMSYRYIFQLGFYLEKKTKWIPVISWITTFVYLLLNWVMIPKYNMMGAAAAKVISFSLLAVLPLLIAKRYYHVNYEFNRFFKLFITGISLYLFSILIPQLRLILFLSFPFVLYLLKFYHQDEIDKIKMLFYKIRLMRR
jgi:O-antigen/teichoic acid export membrane protein